MIAHLPVLCEDHNSPYIFVPSRLELGAAAKTKRPTSVVMITAKGTEKKTKKGDEKEEDDGEDYAEAYEALAKMIKKEMEKQAFW